MDRSDPFSALNPSSPNVARTDAVSPLRSQEPAAQRAQMKQLAQEFEGMLLNEMLSGWRSSLMGDDEEGGEGMTGLSTMTDMVGSEFGRALSKSGGLGIADVLMRSFDRQLSTAPDSTSSGATPITGRSVNEVAIAGQIAPAAAASSRSVAQPVLQSSGSPSGPGAGVAAFEAGATPVTAAVTSPYGWRPDPFTGQTRFHAGVDLRVAYGQDVAAVAPGAVSFAGEQNGYGLTVVVDHGNGVQTRYAHLSSTDVQAGDQVGAGQRIARAGSSGRSTGPHLHVELLSQGKPVDPSGLLKRVAGDAD